uniref:D-lactate dehydrogenase n=1 Tax=Panagrolaimus superbus TaxID=310955 RepID=A0A914Y4C1_9BILA
MSSMTTTDNKAFLNELARLVGSSHLLTDPAKTARYRKGFRSGQGDALAVVFPGSLLELWRVLKACVTADKIILMQAANTGLTEGSTPNGNDYDRDVVIISTLRLDKLHVWQGRTGAGLSGHHALFAGKPSNRWDANRTQ